MNVPDGLSAYRSAGVVGRDDIAAAALLVDMARRDGAAEPGLLAWLGMCLALRTVRDGHTCVDLDRIREWAGEIDVDGGHGLPWPMEADAWIAALRAAAPLVGDPGSTAPFHLDGHQLYLARSRAEEEAIAGAIRTRAASGTIRILLGGPGTGKTTRVANALAARLTRLETEGGTLAVALAAPTGKAAARMAEALARACDHGAVKASPEVRRAITELKPRTVHTLLGYNPRRSEPFAFTAARPLPYDLVIVDEASMLSSSLMHHLLAAVGPHAEIQLVGDPDQLASVDAGTVLGDIALFGGDAHAGTPLHERIETLTRIHRTGSQAILDLSSAIRTGSVQEALAILTAGHADVEWIEPANAKPLERITEEVGRHADRVRELAGGDDPAAVLARKAELQVLCGHREGDMGVAGWNSRIEKRLGVRAADPWYVGRPVMVTRNSPSLLLSNGDVGVVTAGGGSRRAVFGVCDATGAPLQLPVARLEDVETVHALTIHKSQGSEYDHVVVVLPERASRIVTRELFYTGITRARRKVTVVGGREVVEAAIAARIRRATGLDRRLVS